MVCRLGPIVGTGIHELEEKERIEKEMAFPGHVRIQQIIPASVHIPCARFSLVRRPAVCKDHIFIFRDCSPLLFIVIAYIFIQFLTLPVRVRRQLFRHFITAGT